MKIDNLYKEMGSTIENRVRDWKGQLEKLRSSLDALNPRNIMDRGYAAILDGNGKLTGSVDSVSCR